MSHHVLDVQLVLRHPEHVVPADLEDPSAAGTPLHPTTVRQMKTQLELRPNTMR